MSLPRGSRSRRRRHDRRQDRFARIGKTLFRSRARTAGCRRSRRSFAPADCRAPENRCWRARSRPLSRRCPARWCFAPTSSARRFSASPNTDRLPADAYRPELTDRIYRRPERQSRSRRARRPLGHCGRGVCQAARADAIETAAAAAGAGFHGLFLVADLATRLQGSTREAPMHPTPMPRWRARQEDFAIGDVTWDNDRRLGLAGRNARPGTDGDRTHGDRAAAVTAPTIKARRPAVPARRIYAVKLACK